VNKVDKELLVLLVRRERRAILVHKVHREIKVQPVLRARKEIEVNKA
jgi:hypothetical protein